VVAGTAVGAGLMNLGSGPELFGANVLTVVGLLLATVAGTVLFASIVRSGRL
jgi:hypothetical protein